MVLLVLIVRHRDRGRRPLRHGAAHQLHLDRAPGDRRLPGRHPRQPLADALHRARARSRSASPPRSTSRSSPTPTSRWNRLIEVNLQNLAAVPADRLRPARRRGDGADRLRGRRHRARRRHRPGAADPAGHHHHHPRGRPRGAAARSATARSRSAPPCGRPPGGRPCPPRSPASPPARSSASPGRSARRRRCSSSAWPARSASTRRRA